MSREIDVNDPGSWDDDDRVYLAERLDMVPPEHRADLMQSQQIQEPVAPPAVAEDARISRLAEFVRLTLPERADQDPVDAVIEELGGWPEEVEEEEDDYDTWKLSELRDEAEKRQLTVQGDGNKKAPYITALREYDSRQAV